MITTVLFPGFSGSSVWKSSCTGPPVARLPSSRWPASHRIPAPWRGWPYPPGRAPAAPRLRAGSAAPREAAACPLRLVQLLVADLQADGNRILERLLHFQDEGGAL